MFCESFGARNAKRGARNAKLGARNAKRGARNAKRGARNAKLGARNAKRRLVGRVKGGHVVVKRSVNAL